MQNNNMKETTKSSQQNFEELYVNKDYNNALTSLIRNKQQFSSGIFHYNMGTTFAKMGNYAMARFHLEKAIKSGVTNSAVINNLSYVQSQLNLNDISNSTSISDQMINVSLNVPTETYLTISLILMLLLMAIAKFKKSVSKIFLSFSIVLFITPIIYGYVFLENFNYAIVLKDSSVLEGPSKIFSEKSTLKAGSKIILGEFKDGWFFVKSPVSEAGWINKDQLGIY